MYTRGAADGVEPGIEPRPLKQAPQADALPAQLLRHTFIQQRELWLYHESGGRGHVI